MNYCVHTNKLYMASYKSATIALSVILFTVVLFVTLVFVGILLPQLQKTRKLGHAIQSAADNANMCDTPGVQCDFQPDASVQAPSALDSKYNVPTAKFAAQAVAVLEDAMLDFHTPAALPGTRIVAFFSGVNTNKEGGKPSNDRNKNIAWMLVPESSAQQVWLCFRGTQTKAEWQIDFTTNLVPWPEISSDPTFLVHQGFKEALLELVDDIVTELQPLVKAAPDIHVFVAGHSLGASLAALCTLYLLRSGYKNVHTYVFAPPRTGNSTFVQHVLQYTQSGQLVEFNAIANVADLIPQLPLSVQPNLDMPSEPLLYAQFPLYMFQDNWGSWVHNHVMPVYIANLANVSFVNAPPSKASAVVSTKAVVSRSPKRVRKSSRTSAMIRKFLLTF